MKSCAISVSLSRYHLLMSPGAKHGIYKLALYKIINVYVSTKIADNIQAQSIIGLL